MKRSLQVLFFNRQPTNNPQPKVFITPFFLSKLFSTKTSFNTWVSLSDMNLVRPEGKGKTKGRASHPIAQVKQGFFFFCFFFGVVGGIDHFSFERACGTVVQNFEMGLQIQSCEGYTLQFGGAKGNGHLNPQT